MHLLFSMNKEIFQHKSFSMQVGFQYKHISIYIHLTLFIIMETFKLNLINSSFEHV
jgi:hypothetical protein